MKGSKLRKSWDEVFPDGHKFNFTIEKRNFFDVNVPDILARHWRSNSAAETHNPSSSKKISQSFRFPKENPALQSCSFVKKGHPKKTQLHNYRLASLKKDVAELQAKFECEQAKNGILKKALQKASSLPSLEDLTPETTQDLVKEIAMLELEVTNLEQHLLKLYRKAFTQCYPSSAYDCKLLRSNASESSQTEWLQNQSLNRNWQSTPQRSPLWVRQDYNSACDSSEQNWTLQYSHSRSISMPQGTNYHDNFARCFSHRGQRPLAEKTSANAANRLSEDLIRCMAALYCRLAQPPASQYEPEFSLSSTSSASTFYSQRLSTDGWSSLHKDASYEGSCNDFDSNSYTTETTSAFGVQRLYIDDERLANAASMLHNFQSLVQKLEGVDPSKMNHEQKLAFWINVHNALVMHAYLAYGIPQNRLKKISLLQKAAYRIGAHTITAQSIEQSILKCRPYRTAKWLHSILSPAIGRGGGGREYAIQYPEPLLCFALCCGGRSDPAVRVYTHKLIYLELEGAKQEFLQTHVNAHRTGKVFLPSILQSFAKESAMNASQLLEWIINQMKGHTALFISKCIANTKGKSYRCIEWIPYDFTFQYTFAYPFIV